MAQYIAVRALNRSANIRLIKAFNEVQQLVVDATAGHYKLTYAGQTTANILFSATAAQVQSALVALSNIGVDDVVVTGGVGNEDGTNPYYITFAGALSDEDVALITYTAESGGTPLSGGGAAVTITSTTAGQGDGGAKVKLTTTADVIVDLDLPTNARELARHSAIGQWIVTASNDDIGGDALPANS